MSPNHRLRCLMLLVSLFQLAPAPTFGQAPALEWARPLETFGEKFAIYSSGSLRIGSSVLLTSHNNEGSLLWSSVIGSTGSEQVFSVDIDSAGNAFVAGVTDRALAGPYSGYGDAFLIKYDSAGNILWSRQTGTTVHDSGRGVAVDGEGSAYLAGDTFGSLGGPHMGSDVFPDFYLTKFNAAGNQLWSRQVGTTGYEQDPSVAVDPMGNAYVSGITGGSLARPNNGFRDVFVTKYDPAGNLQWARQLGTSTDDFASDMASDGLGNIYISGWTLGSLGGPNASMEGHPDSGDPFLVKYDAAGNLIWSRQLGSTANERSYAVAVDGVGNAYLGWKTAGGPSKGSFLTKYDQQGNPLWTMPIASFEFGTDLAVDDAGTVYVLGTGHSFPTGESSPGQSSRTFLVKVSTVPEPNSLPLAAIVVASLSQRGLRARRRDSHPFGIAFSCRRP